jgi:hypothetical protein
MQAITRALKDFLNIRDAEGRIAAGAKCGVYAFYDYDDEPIYVGQTYEGLRTRIRRHLTNQRTDAVAMHVLDPMEVARIEIWPFWRLERQDKKTQRSTLDRAEYTVFAQLRSAARVSNLLNEKSPTPQEPTDLPSSFTRRIVPEDIKLRLGHADERIARRAATIANLAQVVKERDVSLGLRRTLVTQADRLKLLASSRLQEVLGETPPDQARSELEDDGAAE